MQGFGRFDVLSTIARYWQVFRTGINCKILRDIRTVKNCQVLGTISQCQQLQGIGQVGRTVSNSNKALHIFYEPFFNSEALKH